MNIGILTKKPVVLLIVAVFLLLILAPFTIQAGIFDGWNTTGKTETKDGITSTVEFTKTSYVGSWLSNTDSEQITVQAFTSRAHVAIPIWGFRYNLYIDGMGEPIQTYPTDGGWEPLLSAGFQKAWTTTVKSTGNLRLKVTVDYYYSPFAGLGDKIEATLGWDGAYLKTGRGEIYLPANQLGPFEEGEKVNIYVRTGFTGGAGWHVKMYAPVDNQMSGYPVVIKTLGDDVSTYIEWTVPAGAFKSGTKNEWRAELWNNFFDVGFETIFAIDQKDRAPIITSVTAINSGDSFTYTIVVNKTYAELSHVLVYAWYGYGGTTMPSAQDTESWVIYGVDYAIVGNTATFTVTPKNLDGTIIVKTIAYDVDGRTSRPDFKSFVVEQGSTEPGDDPVRQPFVWTWGAIIAAIITMFAVILLLLFAPVALPIRITLAIIFGAAGAALVWLFGTLQWGV